MIAEQEMIYKTQPYAKQLEAFNRAKGRPEFALLMEMGTGKSKVLIDELVWLHIHKKINAAVIFAPKGCYLNWKEEFLKHFPIIDIPTTICSWKSPSAQSESVKNQLAFFKHCDVSDMLVTVDERDYRTCKFKVLLVNIECLSSKTSMEYLTDFVQKHETLICVDESTTIRNPSSMRTKNARTLAKSAKYRRIMTGTPIANKPLDIYAQCNFLNPSLLGFTNFHTFRTYFADIKMMPAGGNRYYPKLMGYRRLDELTKRLSTFSFRVLKSDCFDMPEKVYQTRYVEPTTDQKRMYNEMAKLMVTEAKEGKFATAGIALTKLMRLHSILCGHLKTDDGKVQEVASNRIKVLEELMEEVSGKAIIWCLYKEDIKNITFLLDKEEYVEYHGETSSEEREAAIHKFKTSDRCRFFIATQRTGGMGLTLTEATTVIYFSQGYDLEMRLQSEDRAHRYGQKNIVTYIDLVVKNSVDEKIVKSLRDKNDLAKTILDHLADFTCPITNLED